jgi:hypothetical protein
MKRFTLLVTLLIMGIFISACTSGDSGASQEGFVFSDEEGLESSEPQGFDFTEDESADNNNSDPNLPGGEPDNDDSGFDFDDDEGLVITTDDSHILPREGLSTWLVSHNEGTATCPGQTITIWGSEDVTITLNVGVEAAGFEVNSFGEAGSMFFILLESGIGGSRYVTDFVPPGSNSPMRYEMLFMNNAGDSTDADFMMGDISGNAEGCDIYRSFQGTLQD